jgi:hypothetical protein
MNKEIGKEYPPVNENKYITQMVDELIKQMDVLYPNGTKMLRQAETKMHACLKAKFIVKPNIEEKYRVGIFAEPESYDCIIRFSSAKTGIANDNSKDQQGMAVKIIGVKGEKLILKEHLAGTQDMIGLNYETFVSKNVKEFAGIIKAFTSGKLSLLLYALNPFHWGLLKRVSKAASKVGALLEESYWSTTPYQFGNGNAMKFMFRSTLDKETPVPKDPGPDYLKTGMARFLGHSDCTFDVMVQLQENADSMPIEDPTVKWTSPYVQLATIYIPKQEFDTNENRLFGETLSFNPWHSLPAHRPLGGLNRARLSIYSSLSEHRHARNGLKVFEPSDMSFKIPD